jgi:uncharacterized protein YuzE
MNVDWDPTGYALYVNLAPEQTGPAARTEDLNDGVLVDLDAQDRPLGVEVLLPRPSLTEAEMRILLGCAMVQARVFDDEPDDPDALQWHPCVDSGNCRAAENTGSCACSGIPYISDALWAHLAPVMKIAVALPDGTEYPTTPRWLAEQVSRLVARRVDRAALELTDSLAQMRRGEGRTVRPGSAG